MRSLAILLAAAIGSGCARGTPEAPDAARVDAPGSGGDAAGDGPGTPIDAPPDAEAHGNAAPLLLTEIVLAPSGGEFIELVNPSDQPVSLEGYHLSDSSAYFRVPAGATVDSTDFIVKFPAGATIGAKAVVTVALDTAANFQTAYGIPPTYTIAGGTMTPVATSGVASLTNGGELVALFLWNGQDDLVRDVDLVLAGVPSAANGLADKSGVALDGPDAGTTATAYAADARTLAAQPTAPAAAKSTKRIALELGHETQAGTGNGITGDDETSEDTAATWDTAFTAPTPGVVPAGLVP